MNSEDSAIKNTNQKEELKKIVATLNKNFDRLSQKYKISELSIIGSYARGEQTKDSDLDIMVDFSWPIGWEVVDLKEDLEEIL